MAAIVQIEGVTGWMPHVHAVAEWLHVEQAAVAVVVIELRLVTIVASGLFHDQPTEEVDRLAAAVTLNGG